MCVFPAFLDFLRPFPPARPYFPDILMICNEKDIYLDRDLCCSYTHNTLPPSLPHVAVNYLHESGDCAIVVAAADYLQLN